MQLQLQGCWITPCPSVPLDLCSAQPVHGSLVQTLFLDKKIIVLVFVYFFLKGNVKNIPLPVDFCLREKERKEEREGGRKGGGRWERDRDTERERQKAHQHTKKSKSLIQGDSRCERRHMRASVSRGDGKKWWIQLVIFGSWSQPELFCLKMGSKRKARIEDDLSSWRCCSQRGGGSVRGSCGWPGCRASTVGFQQNSVGDACRHPDGNNEKVVGCNSWVCEKV